MRNDLGEAGLEPAHGLTKRHREAKQHRDSSKVSDRRTEPVRSAVLPERNNVTAATPPHRRKPLPPTARETLGVIVRFTEHNGYPPTLKELAAQLFLATRGAHDRLLRLKRHGLVDWRDGMARTLKLTPLGVRALGGGR